MFFCYVFVFVFFVRRLPSLNYKFAHVRACWFPFWLFYLSSALLFLLFLGYWAPKFIKFSIFFFNQISTWLEWRQFCWFPVQSVTVSFSLFVYVWKREKRRAEKMFISKKMVNCQCKSNIKWKYKRNLFIIFDFCFNSLSLSLSLHLLNLHVWQYFQVIANFLAIVENLYDQKEPLRVIAGNSESAYGNFISFLI